jgi:hypothetical protein
LRDFLNWKVPAIGKTGTRCEIDVIFVELSLVSAFSGICFQRKCEIGTPHPIVSNSNVRDSPGKVATKQEVDSEKPAIPNVRVKEFPAGWPFSPARLKFDVVNAVMFGAGARVIAIRAPFTL